MIKQTFEISFQVKKWQNYFFQETRACAKQRKCFSSCNQMMRKGELMNMVRVAIESQVSEVRKKVKKN